jgi:hypothetical protein
MQPFLHPRDVPVDKTAIRIDEGELLRLLGEQPGMTDAHTSRLMEHYIRECIQTSSPAAAFLMVEAAGSITPDRIATRGKVFNTGKIVQRMLHNADYYAFFLATAGPEPETLARSLMNSGNYLEGYLADLTASALVESVADQLEDQVRKLAASHGLRITNRFSPGYCSWSVSEQNKLFDLFPEGCCGITLLESSLMKPVKSVSGIIGLGAEVVFHDYPCKPCPMKNCLYRKEGNSNARGAPGLSASSLDPQQ